jgi:hypothetical protein
MTLSLLLLKMFKEVNKVTEEDTIANLEAKREEHRANGNLEYAEACTKLIELFKSEGEDND